MTHSSSVSSVSSIIASVLRDSGSSGRKQAAMQRIYKAGPATQVLLAMEFLQQKKNVVIIVPGAAELAHIKSLVHLFSAAPNIPSIADTTGTPDTNTPQAAGNQWTCFPTFAPQRASSAQAHTPAHFAKRWAALYRISQSNKAQGIVLPLDNLLPQWPPPEVLTTHHLKLRQGDEVPVEELLEQCTCWGYSRVSLVTGHGDLSRRGDIVDIYAPGAQWPLRLEFFGDVLENLRYFDPVSQRSRQEIKEVVLLPVSPVIHCADLHAQARKKWEKLRTTGDLSAQGMQELLCLLENNDSTVPTGLYYKNPVDIGTWLPDDAVYFLCGASELRRRMEETDWSWTQVLEERKKQTGWSVPRTLLLRQPDTARKLWFHHPQIHFEDLVTGQRKDGIDLPESVIENFTDLFWKPTEKDRPWQTLTTALKKWQRQRPQTILSFRTPSARKKFLTLAAQEGLAPHTSYQAEKKGLFALVSGLKKGVELEWNSLFILSENVLLPHKTTPRAHIAGDSFEGLSGKEDLVAGELLVHRDFGLGRFQGLQHLSMGSACNDYLLLTYQGEDKLYVPVDRLDVIQRYKGPEGASPVLDKLGGTGWVRSQERARKAIEKIAKELVEMYAYRKVTKGYAYEPPGELYAELEASFGFEETPDQTKAIADVLHDMEQAEPMDRLVCGDVGFGKTEVAIRAAFRAAADGKQVALLCPTTVLAQQHYENFVRRMEGFGLQIAVLSRFIPPKRQKTIVQAAARAEIDILIGTHRLLSADVELPNLGLFILDEEQRFGVKHKERLKELKKDIDVLALTATPIPRTLQLSLSGIRKLSVMETPPVDRKPVQTSLLERDPAVLREIVERELARKGQVFWVHNRVRGLERVVEFVRELAPQARIGMAHGQMREKELEESVNKFWHGETDILVCTAIVESGLDFPRANTLIVDQAQLFGLGQLYQLRGRVGRSSQQAHACFIISDLDNLPAPARKRLQVILDLDYLGAGFRVAMEDLRLRGAGNILGEVQSGTMAKVGLDLFLEMLDEEIHRQKGQELERAIHPELTLHFDAFLPQDYITDSARRLRYYRALTTTGPGGRLHEIVAEIRDRFGPLPEQALRFVEILQLKALMASLRIPQAELYENRIVLTFCHDSSAINPAALVSFIQQQEQQTSGTTPIRLLPPDKLELRPAGTTLVARLAQAQKELTRLADRDNTKATSPPTQRETYAKK